METSNVSVVRKGVRVKVTLTAIVGQRIRREHASPGRHTIKKYYFSFYGFIFKAIEVSLNSLVTVTFFTNKTSNIFAAHYVPATYIGTERKPSVYTSADKVK